MGLKMYFIYLVFFNFKFWVKEKVDWRNEKGMAVGTWK